MRGEANMDQCPLCLHKQASGKKISDGFGEGSVAVTPGMPIIYHLTCPDCDAEYDITDDAILFLKRCDGMRQRAVKDIRGRGFTEIPIITSEMLQGYWTTGDGDQRTP
jgi:hypothetical protein